jgi:hypothetical protein
MARRPLKDGDIVKVTEFGGDQTLLWARVTKSINEPLYFGKIVFFAAGEDQTTEIISGDWGTDEDPWPLDGADKFTIVPENRVPGWVWVQVAQRALLGE